MKKKGIKIIFSILIFFCGYLIPFPIEWIRLIFFGVSYWLVGWEIIKKAIRNIRRGKVFDENFLMTVATIGAFCIGEYPEAVAVMIFYQIGELFQHYAVDKSRKSIASLMDIRPDFANVEKEGKIEKVEPIKVKIGDIIVVKPGEKIPLDGVILEGKSSLDTKALTGESILKEVEETDTVMSGCVNTSGVLKIKVTKEFGESTVSKILDLVENASSKKAKSENFITKFAQYYTPIVVGIAILLAVIPPIVLPGSTFSDWIYRALSFLVVSCPCALVISIPLSFFGGIGGASKMGILMKGSNYIEALAKADIFVFDKTGTLTEGSFDIEKIVPIGISEEELLKLTTYAESYSNHPISVSLKNAYAHQIQEEKILEVQELSGRGVMAVVEGKTVLVGNEKLMKEKQISYKQVNEVGTIIYVAIDGNYAGYVVICDKIKKDAKETIQELKKKYAKQIVMLTGDRKEVGEMVGKELEIDQIYTELLPDGKVEKVEELLKKKGEKETLAFVGDGINDAPVLTLADVGIAMGGLGSDAAIEAADVVLMTDEPYKILDAISLSKKTMRIVKENIIFAIGIKIAVLCLSACGLSTMWEAVFADVGVSIIAILNALRVLAVKKKI